MKTQQRGPNFELDFFANTRYNPLIQNYLKLTNHNISKYKDFISYPLLPKTSTFLEKKMGIFIALNKFFRNIVNIFCYDTIRWLTNTTDDKVSRRNKHREAISEVTLSYGKT